MLVLVFSQMVAALGYGDYFPWSIPAFYAVWGGRLSLNAARILIILSTGIIGMIGTIWRWVFADQH